MGKNKSNTSEAIELAPETAVTLPKEEQLESKFKQKYANRVGKFFRSCSGK